MNVLIIIANPRANSFSHQIASAYLDGAIAAGKRVETLDLYTTDLQLDFLRPETPDEFDEQQPVREALQRQLAGADELVVVHPLWWGGPPAILKNYIDQIFMPGFAYRYKRRPRLPKQLDILPERLLRDKQARLFVTGDGQHWTNRLRLMPWLMTWRYYVLGFSGISLKSVRFFDFMRHRSALKRSQWLADVHRLAQK